MKFHYFILAAVLAIVLAEPKGRTWPQFFDRFTQRVDTIADRIDHGLQQTFQPVVDQLQQNVRETLNIWNRPFLSGSSSSGPISVPNSQNTNPAEGFHPFDLGLSPFFQGLFDNPQRDWWKGPNVCIEREEIDETKNNNTSVEPTAVSNDEAEGEASITDEILEEDKTDGRQARQFAAHVRLSSCHDEGLAYVCETKIRSNGIRKVYKTKYNCCYGTIRENGEFGCHNVEMRSLQETVFALGGRSFLTLMKETEIDEKMTSINRTYFVPVDRSAPAAADSANDVQNEDYPPTDLNEASIRKRRQITVTRLDVGAERDKQEMRSTVLGHVVPGIYLTTDFRDEQILSTENEDAKIRINLYNAPDRVYTANCIRLVSVNNYAQQGVVHMLDGVMKPATKTLADLINSEPHFESFRNLIKQHKWMDKLDQDGHLTVFAPTDDAFAKLDPETRDRLMKGEGCVHSILQQHMLPNVICSTVIQGRARSTTMLGTSLLLERDLESKLYVNGKQVITRDVIATNGVLHVIDGVLIPENARSFSQLIASRNLTELSRLVEASGLTSTFDSMTNATFFAPNNEAVHALPDELKQSWITHPEKLKDVLLYHVTQPIVRQSTARNNQVVGTELKDQSLRINFYPTMAFFNAFPLRATAQCANIIRWEQEACNGNVHVIDRFLIPPEKSITEWLANNRSYSIMTKLLKATRLSELLQADGPYTVLAAPDVAFYQLPEEVLSEMMKDTRKASAVLKNHILPEFSCCAGFRGDWFTNNRRRTMEGSWLPLQRHLDGRLTAGDTNVLSCDHITQNGVIHIVDQVLQPKSGGLPFLSGTRRFSLPGMELVLNGKK